MKKSLLLLILLIGPAFSQPATDTPELADVRDDFEATAYLGLSIDTFTAQASRNVIYGNPEDNGTKRERLVGGFDFAYRLWRGKDTAKASTGQLWIYGQTVHGVRSAEVDCNAPEQQRPGVCSLGSNPLTPATNPGQQLVYLLRNASSLEAHMGLRYEFMQLNANGKNPARLYVKAQAGFLSIAQSGGDVFDVHQLALGALATKGKFEGSFLEAGYGRNDVFIVNRYRRAMVDGYLTWGNGKLASLGMKPFIEMVVDSDLGRGADSVQTFIGLTIDLDKINF